MDYSVQIIDHIPDTIVKELTGTTFITIAHNPCLIDILHKTFGWHGGSFLILKKDLPVAYFPCMLIGSRIVSMPHFSHGGLITTKANRRHIYDSVLPLILKKFRYDNDDKIRREIPVEYLIREPFKTGNYLRSDKLVSFLNIKNKTIDQVIPLSQQTKVNRAREAGLTCKRGGVELIKDFFQVYCLNMHRLGSPVLPSKFFKNILEDYRDGEALIFCIYKQGKPIGASFLMSFNGYFENTWFSTIKSENPYCPAQILHWEMINFAIEKQGHTYSFGRSTTGSGVHKFKKKWGTEEEVIYWNYNTPVSDIRNQKILGKLWRLLPLKIAAPIGSRISKNIY